MIELIFALGCFKCSIVVRKEDYQNEHLYYFAKKRIETLGYGWILKSICEKEEVITLFVKDDLGIDTGECQLETLKPIV